MKFENTAQKQTYEKVAKWLQELWGDKPKALSSAPIFSVHAGSAVIQVSVKPFGDNDSYVVAISWVVRDIELEPDLMEFLLKENDRVKFGGFGVDGDDDIFFRHAIVGSTIDKKELETLVVAVAITADEYDDKIIQRWGGQSGVDHMKAMILDALS